MVSFLVSDCGLHALPFELARLLGGTSIVTGKVVQQNSPVLFDRLGYWLIGHFAQTGLESAKLLSKPFELAALLILRLLDPHHLLELLYLFCLLQELRFFVLVDLAFEQDHVSLELLKFKFEIFSDPVCGFHFGLHLDQLQLLLAQFGPQHLQRTFLHFRFQSVKLSLGLLHEQVSVCHLFGEPLLVALQVLALFFEFHLDIQNLFLLMSQLSSDFLDFVL
jgi:hypothetical protein